MRDRLTGINSVREALASGRRPVHRIYLAGNRKDQAVKPVLEMARSRRIPVEQVDRAFLDHLSGHALHQGIVAEADPYFYYDLADILDQVNQPALVLLLDGIEDPQNLGAILRTAEGFGVQGVIIPGHNACPVTPAVVRASAGASEHIKVARVTNLVQAINLFKQKDFWIIGTDAEADVPCHSFDFPEKAALVMGGERKGMRRLVRENCDVVVRIPVAGRVNSLNVSVAAAIVLYEAVRSRLK